jgi:hypothetical protein
MVYQHGSSTKSLQEDVNKVFDDAIETLRWTRLHYHEPKAAETLRELEAKLGYLAQAIVWNEEKQVENAYQALGLAQGRSLREQDAVRRMWEEMWWSH